MFNPENSNLNSNCDGSSRYYTYCSPPLTDKASLMSENKYRLQDKIQKFLLRNTPASVFKEAKKCLVVPRSSEVQIYRSKKTGKHFYGNLCQCSNLWLCPVCGSKILARRGVNEISKAMYKHYHNSPTNNVLMITFTHPHHAGQPLKELIAKHDTALGRLKGVRAYVKLMNELNCVASVRSNEVTYSDANSWHWHTHQLLFIKRSKQDIDVESLRMKIARLWLLRCKAVGMTIPDEVDFLRYSVNVMNDCHASDYLTKVGSGYWGADRELTSSASKRGYGRTPFELIASNDKKDNSLFLEYAYATIRKTMIKWGTGSKKYFGIEDKTDEEVNEEKLESADLIANLQLFVWQNVLDNSARATVLNLLNEGGLDLLLGWFIHMDIVSNDYEFS